jgi:hypothetical protein
MTEVEIAEDNIRTYIKNKLGLKYNAMTIKKVYENGSWVASIVSESNIERLNGSAGFRVYGFPGCCKYAIISQMFTKGTFSNIGLVKRLFEWAEMIGIYDHEVSALVGTCADGPNSFMMEIVEKYGWKEIHNGDNPNSGNWVRMYVKELDVPDEMKNREESIEEEW